MNIRHLTLLLSLALAIPVAVSVAQEPSVVSPDAEKVLARFLQQIESSESVIGDLKTVEQVHSGGEIVFETKTNYLAAGMMPNKLVLKVTGEDLDIAIMSDGQTLNMLLTPGAYVQIDSPATMDQLLGQPGIPEGEIIDALLALTIPAKGIREKLLRGVESVDVADVAPNNGDVSTSTLKFTKADGSQFDLTITSSDPPRLASARVDMTEPVKRADRRARVTPGFKFVVEIDVDQWSYNDARDETFAFIPPEGTKAFPSIEALVKSLDGPPHPLVGQPAPGFDAPGMDDNVLNLDRHRGKDIVILDFWFTSCPPCRVAMPVIFDVASEFKDQGVVLYGVNNKESKETIAEFLSQSGLELTVVRDRDGAIANAYQVNGYPMTVIIGRDGVVETVHLGYRTLDGLRADLTDQLQTLVEGGHLIESEQESSE